MVRTTACRSEQTRVLIVDPRPQDYLQLVAESATGAIPYQFATTSSDALKLWRTAGRSIWLVNVNLPDGSGCELAAAIRARDPRSVVYLIGDEYDAEEEVRARMVGGAMYVCKPAASAWLSLLDLPVRPLTRCA